jgi:hypothetical protein
MLDNTADLAVGAGDGEQVLDLVDDDQVRRPVAIEQRGWQLEEADRGPTRRRRAGCVATSQ